MNKNVDQRNTDHISGFKREVNKAKGTSKDAFFAWFDGAKDADAAFISGAWDFSHYFARPLSFHLKKPETKIAVEIGYGGGRVLAAASKYFKEVIGVDIHECSETVNAEFKKRGITNAKLYTGDGKSIPLNDASVDVVYSFIVLQHVEKIEIFRAYIKEAYRILKPGGIAVLYFGRYCRFSLNKESKVLYEIDNLLEKYKLHKGYKEIKAEVNCINLLVAKGYMKRLAKHMGFSIHEELVSRKGIPNSTKIYGLQNGLLMKKV